MTNSEQKPIYLDTTYSTEERVQDLIAHMTLEEKISQMTNTSDAIGRLDIPAYDWWSECLHGVARAGRATVFPQSIGLAATFDRNLVYKVATAISDEARARYHDKNNQLKNTQYLGLTFWSPNINIFRDPRWGRGQETYGEDPYLTAELGKAFVKGLQGSDPRYLKVAACAKHFVVHSGPEKLRHKFNAIVSKKDLFETYLPAFKALVDAGVEAIMGAYNRVNDEPCCGSKTLLQDILRDKWAFKGHIVSDCWAIVDFYEHHKITSSAVESAALAVNNGCNLNCGSTFPFLLAAVNEGLVNEKTIDEALSYLLKTRFKLGMFDPEDQIPYSKLSPDIICSSEHRNLAREAAVKSIVLLRNENNLLPLSKNKHRNILVVGPNAGNIDVLLGNYHGVSEKMITILEGVVGKADKNAKVSYRAGALLNEEYPNPVNYALFEVYNVDVIIAVFGLQPTLEGEEGAAILSTEVGDRFDIQLPQNQLNFLQKIKDSGTPVVLILTGGSPVSFPKDIADAILYVWYPGEQGGGAVADILFGYENPSGKLPVTFPKSLDDVPDFKDYNMINRTYRYSKVDPLFPFGFGLHYSQLTYKLLSISSTVLKEGEDIHLTIEVSNNGKYNTEEVLQLYVTDVEASVEVPLYSLKDFKRLNLSAGESSQITFDINTEMLKLINEKGERILEPGEFLITIGGSSPSKRSIELGDSPPIIQKIEVR
ncbi:MAG: glycoside hydrolase family 3 C-terminal domain-containing protein [Candidatus Heimdallarchaeota archaeon]|nr:MAG: glycoside hydrolase family 3 C-terminal domain-containing protein [Candidatus Heimdallarchaeota archaeon]